MSLPGPSLVEQGLLGVQQDPQHPPDNHGALTPELWLPAWGAHVSVVVLPS